MNTLDDEIRALRERVAELEAGDAERQRAERVQSALYRIAETASVATDMQDFYGRIHAIVRELMYADNFYIALYDKEREMISFPYFVDEVDLEVPDPDAWEPAGIGMASGLTAYMLRAGHAMLHTMADWQRLIDAGKIARVGEASVDWLGVPLQVEGRTIGGVVVQSYREDRRHTDADLELLTFVARHIASALERTRLIDETRQRNAELSLINEVQRGLAQNLDMQSMYDLVGDRIQEIFDAQVVDIAFVERDANVMRSAYMLTRGERGADEPFEIVGVTRHVLEKREPVVINERLEERVAELGGAVVVGEIPRSAVYVPLVVGGEATGRVSLQNLDRERAFSDADVRLLMTLAGSLSVALENARLFEETRQRNAELAVITEVQRALAENLDMQAMYELVGDRIQRIFDAQVVDIGIVDRDAELIRFPYAIERGVRFPDEPMEVSGFRGEALETQSPVVVNERLAERSAQLGQPPVHQGEPPLSSVFVPFIVAGRATGVISLQNLDREHAFSENDVRLLTTLAGSLSVALENARLFEETGRRAAELEVVNNVGQALADQLDLDALIDRLGDQLREVFAADLVYVALHDRSAEMIRFAYYSEHGERRENPAMRYGEGLTSRILRAREPLLLNRAAAFEEVGAAAVGTPVKSYLGVPIIVGSDAIGVISVQSTTQEGRFGPSDTRLLSTIGANVGAAIQNAQLYVETQRRAIEM
ncbi:MAG TPA: GAF domain-containing protein, partial [Actinomycetota bacterium]|nr:GAF domain-containing protein [Actinomycetota bacterium]